MRTIILIFGLLISSISFAQESCSMIALNAKSYHMIFNDSFTETNFCEISNSIDVELDKISPYLNKYGPYRILITDEFWGTFVFDEVLITPKLESSAERSMFFHEFGHYLYIRSVGNRPLFLNLKECFDKERDNAVAYTFGTSKFSVPEWTGSKDNIQVPKDDVCFNQMDGDQRKIFLAFSEFYADVFAVLMMNDLSANTVFGDDERYRFLESNSTNSFVIENFNNSETLDYNDRYTVLTPARIMIESKMRPLLTKDLSEKFEFLTKLEDLMYELIKQENRDYKAINILLINGINSI